MVEMVRKAQDQLLHYPVRSAGAEVKRMIRQLLGQKVAPKDSFNWPNGLLAKALIDYYYAHQNSEEAREIQETNGKEQQRLTHDDTADSNHLSNYGRRNASKLGEQRLHRGRARG